MVPVAAAIVPDALPLTVSPPSWGVVNVSAVVDVIRMQEADRPPVVWLGIGEWTFSAPPAGVEDALWRDFLAAHPKAGHARVLASTGFPVVVEAFATVEEAQAGNASLSMVALDLGQTYALTTYTPPGGAHAVRIRVGSDVDVVMSMDTGEVLVNGPRRWSPLDSGEILLMQAAQQLVMVEDDCFGGFGYGASSTPARPVDCAALTPARAPIGPLDAHSA